MRMPRQARHRPHDPHEHTKIEVELGGYFFFRCLDLGVAIRSGGSLYEKKSSNGCKHLCTRAVESTRGTHVEVDVSAGMSDRHG
jgi:hypothetical protein